MCCWFGDRTIRNRCKIFPLHGPEASPNAQKATQMENPHLSRCEYSHLTMIAFLRTFNLAIFGSVSQ